MKAQNLIVRCYCTNDGATAEEIIHSSFLLFLKGKLDQFASATQGRDT